jgi:hypothetical protein
VLLLSVASCVAVTARCVAVIASCVAVAIVAVAVNRCCWRFCWF